MLAEKNNFIKQSIVTLQELTADEKAKMQMEARERYRRDMAASVELGKQQSAEVIQALKSTVDEQQNMIDEQQTTLLQSQSENRKLQEEKNKMQERIRFLEAQLEQANKKNK